MKTVKTNFISKLFLFCALIFIPCFASADEQTDGFFLFEAGILSEGNFFSEARKTILREKPEATKIKKEDSNAFLFRFAINAPYNLFNTRPGIAIDIGSTPSVSFYGKEYIWSSYYSAQTFGDGVVLRLMLTNEYFAIGSAKTGKGLAVYTGVGGSLISEMQFGIYELEDAEDYGGISYEYGLKYYLRLDPGFSMTLGATKSAIIKSSDFSWETTQFLLGGAWRF